MNLNKFHKFVSECKSNPKEDKSISIYEDFFSPTGLYLEYSNNLFTIAFSSSNYTDKSDAIPSPEFTSVKFRDTLFAMTDKAFNFCDSKNASYTRDYSIGPLEAAFLFADEILDKNLTSDLCSDYHNNLLNNLHDVNRNASFVMDRILFSLRLENYRHGFLDLERVDDELTMLKFDIKHAGLTDKDVVFQKIYLDIVNERSLDERLKSLESKGLYGGLPANLSKKHIKDILPDLYKFIIEHQFLSEDERPDLRDALRNVEPAIKLRYLHPADELKFDEDNRKKSRKSKRSK